MTIEPGEISLGGYKFKIEGEVRSAALPRFPGRVVTGTVNESDEQNASAWIIQDLSGGIGVLDMDPDAQADRGWFILADVRGKAFGLPPLANDAGNPTTTNVSEIVQFGGEVYVAFGADVYKYAAPWGAKLHSCPGTVMDWMEFGGKLYLACGASGWSTFDGTNWVDVTDQDMLHVTIYDGKLIKIDNAGNITSSTDGTTWTAVLSMTYPAGSYTGLFTYIDLAGDSAIYVAHRQGLDYLDFANKKSYRSGLQLPRHAYGGKGAGVWRGDAAFYAAGLSVYNYSPGSVRAVGLDRDEGVPSDMRGNIIDLKGTHYALMAALDNTTAKAATQDLWTGSFGALRPKVVGDNVGFSYVLSFTGSAWVAWWQSGQQAAPITCLTLADTPDYRLWFGADEKLFYIKLPLGVSNPRLFTDSEYAASGMVITPWYNGKMATVDKVALTFEFRGLGLSATETVRVSYGIDDSEAWTELGLYATNEPAEYVFATGGLTWRKIRFKFELVRGSDTHKSPWVIAAKLRFRRSLPALRAWDVRIKCLDSFDNLTPKQQLAKLYGFESSQPLLPFIFDDSGATYWVEVTIPQGSEVPGREKKGILRVVLSEVS